jgi:hypothetical protein
MRNWRTTLAVTTIAVFALAACGDTATTTSTEAPEAEDTDETEATDPEEEPEEEPEEAATKDEPTEGEPTEQESADDGELAIGETGRVGDYDVTVTDFAADDTQWVLGENEFNEEPSNGVYATVTFDATYLGDEDGTPGFDLSAKLVVEGVQHADYECGAYFDGGGMDAPTLENGGTATDITFCFDHPGVDESSRMFFEETISFDSERVYWSIR